MASLSQIDLKPSILSFLRKSACWIRIQITPKNQISKYLGNRGKLNVYCLLPALYSGRCHIRDATVVWFGGWLVLRANLHLQKPSSRWLQTPFTLSVNWPQRKGGRPCTEEANLKVMQTLTSCPNELAATAKMAAAILRLWQMWFWVGICTSLADYFKTWPCCGISPILN